MIKLIATDLDGTLLDPKSRLDPGRFWRVFDRIKAAGCHFVLASGDQYYCMRNYFGPRGEELSYVAENGAWVRAEGGRTLFCAAIPETLWKPVARSLRDHRAYPQAALLVCGKKQAYLPANLPPDQAAILAHFYPSSTVEEDLDAIGDEILKLCLLVPEAETDRWFDGLRRRLPAGMTPTGGGNGCIDLIATGLHKAAGIRLLLDEYGVRPEECIAFGDSGNDLEMLAFVGESYAVANARPEVLAAAKHRAPANSEHGVLQVLEQLFPAR